MSAAPVAGAPAPLVSVLMLTYNHERMVRRAIESAAAQQTRFAFEIVVGDDCSTDDTRGVLQALASEFPDRVRLILRPARLGLMANLRQTYAACRGEYVAVLEGDDYWIHPGKLQKQIDFLEAHPECPLCFHRARIADERTRRDRAAATLFAWNNEQPAEMGPARRKALYRLDEILESNFVPTCAVVARKWVFTSPPEWLWTLPAADWPSFVLAAQHGPLGYIDEVLSVYRLHDGCFSERISNKKRLEAVTAAYEHLQRHLGPRYRSLIQLLLARNRALDRWESERLRLVSALHDAAAGHAGAVERRTRIETEREALRAQLAGVAQHAIVREGGDAAAVAVK